MEFYIQGRQYHTVMKIKEGLVVLINWYYSHSLKTRCMSEILNVFKEKNIVNFVDESLNQAKNA